MIWSGDALNTGLDDSDPHITLKVTIKFIEAKESGKLSQATSKPECWDTILLSKDGKRPTHSQLSENQAMVTFAKYRLGRRSARPGTKFVHNVTKKPLQQGL